MKIAVIDTETNWEDQVMSIGVIAADGETFAPVDGKYYILTPEIHRGGMYESVLFTQAQGTLCSRKAAMEDLHRWLDSLNITRLYAYNAAFDCKHLTELSRYAWFDIMRLAAYRQFNPCIPDCADCFRTGRLKRNYGVEPITRLLTGDLCYCETHNAYQDALDELQIMRFLGQPLQAYEVGRL